MAVLFTGFLRENVPAQQAFPQFNSPDIDFYAACWSIRSTKAPGGRSKDDSTHITNRDVQDRYGSQLKAFKVVDYYEYTNNRPYKFEPINRPDDVFKVAPRAINHARTAYPQRIIDMNFMNLQVLNLVDNLDQYDCVIRFRHDMRMTQNFPIEQSDLTILNLDDHQMQGKVQPHGEYDKMTNTDLDPFGLSYQVAWGNPDVMRRFLSAFNHLRRMYEEHNLDLSAYEHVTSFYVQRIAKLKYKVYSIQNNYYFVR